MMHILRGSEVAGYWEPATPQGDWGAWPPSSVSLAEGDRRPRAVLTACRGWRHGLHGNSAAPTRDGRPVRRTVAMHAPGFGGGRLYCSHAPSRRRYVGAVLEGAILAACLEPALLWPASWSRSSCGRLLGVGLLVASFLESAFLWLSSGGFQGRAAFQ